MDFNTWKQFYQWGWATKEQLQQAVQEDMLTQQQYDEIVGIQKPAPTSAPAPVTQPSSTISNTQTAPVEDNTKAENSAQNTEPVKNAEPVVKSVTENK